jgi:deazaflavin-dependent oxidoreductase (nitroreductase family)
MDEQSNAQWKGRIRTTEADSLFGEEHVRRYRETDGDVGHIWQGSTVLLLTTKGGSPVSRAPHRWPTTGLGTTSSSSPRMARARASGWYRNLTKVPQVEVQVNGGVFRARARTTTGGERQRLWTLGARQHPDWDRFKAGTEREIPVVVLQRSGTAGHDTTVRGGTR